MEKKDILHHLVTKLLFLSKLSSLDFHTAVEILTTCMKNPDKDDIKNYPGWSDA